MSKRFAELSVDEPTLKIAKVEQDGRLQLRNSPCSLQNLACIRIAVSLWYHQNVRHLTQKVGYLDGDSTDEESVEDEEEEYHWRDRYDSDYECKSCIRNNRVTEFSATSLKSEVERSVAELTLPPSLVEGIIKFIPRIGSAIDKWVTYQHKRIFFDLSKEMVYKHVDEIVWKSNGKINYAETGKNMLSSLKINEVEKYRIICTYCLKDELQNVSPLLFSGKYFENVNLQNHPLIYYWNCVSKKELNEINVEGVNSAESRMITLKNVDNKLAIIYFFEQLTEEDKVEKAKLLIGRYHRKYQKILINHLTEVQQHHVFLEIGVDVVLNFAQSPSWWKHALNCWIFMQNLVTKEQYYDMINELLNFVLGSNQSQHGIIVFYDNFARISYPHIYHLLASIWKKSPNHCKQYALQHNESRLIKRISGSTYSEKNMELLRMMLSDASDDVKKQIIWSDSARNLCESQVRNSRPLVLHNFIKLCLSDANDALEFRNQLLKSHFVKDHCLNLCINRQFDELNNFIAICSQNPDVTNEYLAQLLTSEKGIVKFVQNLRCFDISSFKSTVKQLLPDTNHAAVFMRNIVSSATAIKVFFLMTLKGEIDKVMGYVDESLSNENDVKTVKNSLLDFFQGEEITKLFAAPVIRSRNSCREFILWCLNSEENVSNFKRSLPFERIFLKLLKKSIFTSYDATNLRSCKFKTPFNFDALDRFLLWFFVSSDATKKFKIQQIFNFRKIELIGLLVRKTDHSYLKNAVDWFFNGDVQQIGRFKSVYPRSPITKLL